MSLYAWKSCLKTWKLLTACVYIWFYHQLIQFENFLFGTTFVFFSHPKPVVINVRDYLTNGRWFNFYESFPLFYPFRVLYSFHRNRFSSNSLGNYNISPLEKRASVRVNKFFNLPRLKKNLYLSIHEHKSCIEHRYFNI